MQNQVNIWGIAVLVFCCGALLEATPIVPGIPGGPVRYKQFTRRRSDPKNPELDVYEVREVYYLRRTTPRPKNVRKLTDLDMDLRILCDFSPRPECARLDHKPIYKSSSSSSTTTTTTATTTRRTSTTTTTEDTSAEETTTRPETTTTDLPFLPDLTTQTEEQTTVSEEINYDDIEENEEENNEDVADETDTEKEPDAEDYANPGGSIGGIDLTE